MFTAAVFLGLVLVSSLEAAQELSAVVDRSGVRIWMDRGGTSGNDLTVYEPIRSSSSFYSLGQRAQPNYGNLNRDLHSFKDDSPRKDALARPEGFRFIYDTRGSTYVYDASAWRPICPNGYVALGDFFHNQEMLTTPPKQMFDKIRCVRERLTDNCDIGTKVWTNSGTIGRFYASVWNVNRRSGQFATFFFYVRDQHNQRPDTTAKCLKESSVRVRY